MGCCNIWCSEDKYRDHGCQLVIWSPRCISGDTTASQTSVSYGMRSCCHLSVVFVVKCAKCN